MLGGFLNVASGPNGYVAVVIPQVRQTSERPSFVFRLDERIPSCVRRVEKLKIDICGAKVPEANKIIDVARFANKNSGVIPSAANAIVAAEPLTRQSTKAWMIQGIEWDRQGFVDGAINRQCCLQKQLAVVDADVGGIGICAVMQKEGTASGSSGSQRKRLTPISSIAFHSGVLRQW